MDASCSNSYGVVVDGEGTWTLDGCLGDRRHQIADINRRSALEGGNQASHHHRSTFSLLLGENHPASCLSSQQAERMSLVPRSSLRSLVLHMSQRKPGLSYFSSAATFAPRAALRGDCSASEPPPAPVAPKYDITVDPKGLCSTLQPETDKPSPGAIKDPNGPVPEVSPSTPGPEHRKDPDHGVPEGPNSETPRFPILQDPGHGVPEGPNNG